MKIKKHKKYLILFLLSSNIIFSQQELNSNMYNLGVGIGVHLFNSTSLTDYLNSISPRRYDDFITNPEFFVSFGRQLNKDYSVNLDYTYIVNSFNFDKLLVYTENHLYIHTPIIILYRYYKTNGLIYKIGAGAGYSYAALERKILNTQVENFYSQGFGLKFGVEANTPFGDNIYGLIASDIKLFLMSEFKNSNSEKLTYRYGSKNKNLDLDFFNISLKFGFIYYF